MKVRQATLKDGRAVRALIRMYPDKLMQKHLPNIENFFVAIEGKKIVGCCALEIYSQRLAEIRSLAVHPDHGDNRFASELVDCCLRKAKRHRVYEVLSITGRPALFERQGFGAFNKEQYALLMVLGKSRGGGQK